MYTGSYKEIICCLRPEGSASQRPLISKVITIEYLKMFELRLIQSHVQRGRHRHAHSWVRIHFLRVLVSFIYWCYNFFKNSDFSKL